jgi:proteasome lid subunit RPN8/RPN11
VRTRPVASQVNVRWLLSEEEVSKLLRKARARARSLVEIAGLIVGNDCGCLSLVEVRNISRRKGTFQLHRGDWRAVDAASVRLGWKVVGTFHSHVASDPVPSRGDVAGAISGHLMLIIDTTARCIALWRIRGTLASKQAYRLLPTA